MRKLTNTRADMNTTRLLIHSSHCFTCFFAAAMYLMRKQTNTRADMNTTRSLTHSSCVLHVFFCSCYTTRRLARYSCNSCRPRPLPCVGRDGEQKVLPKQCRCAVSVLIFELVCMHVFSVGQELTTVLLAPVLAVTGKLPGERHANI
jgi:hypothetical protein